MAVAIDSTSVAGAPPLPAAATPDGAPTPAFTPSADDLAYAGEDAAVTALAERGDTGAARRRLDVFVARHPAAAEAHNDLGVLAYQAGALPAALAALDRAVALRPSCARYHRHRALVLLDAGDARGAVAALERALELDPTDRDTQRVLAEVTSAFADARRELVRRSANKEYWSACTDTHLASPDYYRRARAALSGRLAELLRPGDRMIELGCGDGEASLDAAPRCASVMGYDVSAALVEQANVRAREAGLTHVHFRTADLEDAALPEVDDNVDVLLCLGVLSCLPDDAAARVIDHVGRGLRPGALLVLRETVSSGARRDVVYASGYCGRYRPLDAYLQAVADAGFTLFEDVPLTAEGGLENHLWLFRRDGNPGRVPKPSRDELGPA